MKTFSARETVWLQELDGVELAGFWRRAFALVLDGVLASLSLTVILGLAGLAYLGVRKAEGRPVQMSDAQGLGTEFNNVFAGKAQIHIGADDAGSKETPDGKKPHLHISMSDGRPETENSLAEDVGDVIADIVIPVLYFGVFLWLGNGRTPGKRLMKIRVVSLMHTHMSFWHSVERALGYGAAMLEGGFGFVQYFIHPYRRCAQDRLAETIVVTERSYQQRFPPRLGTTPESEAAVE